MSKKEIGSIPQIAQTLVNHLPEEIDHELKRLIASAEKGQDTTIEIINLLTQYEGTRVWIQQQINSSSRGGGAPPEFSGLAGNPFVPFSHRWVCPINSREHWVMVIQTDEDPPTCQVDEVKMVRGS